MGGVAETRGEDPTCAQLATILGEMDEEAAGAHVHGFHAYPARMHPTLARRCIELMAPTKGLVFDPFCGSGTVLVEARLASRPSQGRDLNPLAVLLSRLKTRDTSDRELRALTMAARNVAKHATGRRKAKLGATHRYPSEDVKLFDPHVLLELDGLCDGLENVQNEFLLDALRLVLSSILTKVSRKTGDTTGQHASKRFAAGFTVNLFEIKAQELARRIDAYRRLLPTRAPSASVEVGDARQLRTIRDGSVHLVLTSPPYAGTYDYLEHHRTRLRWLRLPAVRMRKLEMGARRNLSTAAYEQAVEQFADDMTAVLTGVRRILDPDGRVVLVIADSVVAERAVWVDPLVQRCAIRAGLRWVATGSQVRPHFHGPSRKAFDRHLRKEHTIVLARG